MRLPSPQCVSPLSFSLLSLFPYYLSLLSPLSLLSHLEEAVKVMLDKSEGAFVYIARALDDLDKQEQQVWTVDQLKAMLPEVGVHTSANIGSAVSEICIHSCMHAARGGCWRVSYVGFWH